MEGFKKLKPCDCGGEAKLYKDKGFVLCLGCNKTTKVYRSDKKAVEGWNGNWTYYDR